MTIIIAGIIAGSILTTLMMIVMMFKMDRKTDTGIALLGVGLLLFVLSHTLTGLAAAAIASVIYTAYIAATPNNKTRHREDDESWLEL